MLVSFGLRNVESKTHIHKHDEKAWEVTRQLQEEETSPTSLDGFEIVDHAAPCMRLGPCIPVIHEWIRWLTMANDSAPLWLCSYQLLAHYQVFAGGVVLV